MIAHGKWQVQNMGWDSQLWVCAEKATGSVTSDYVCLDTFVDTWSSQLHWEQVIGNAIVGWPTITAAC